MKTADAHNKDLTGRVEVEKLTKSVLDTVSGMSVHHAFATGQLVDRALTAERERITKAVEMLDSCEECDYPVWVRFDEVIAIINQEKP